MGWVSPSLSAVSAGNTVENKIWVYVSFVDFFFGEILGLLITIGLSTVLLMLVLGIMTVLISASSSLAVVAYRCGLLTVMVTGLSTNRSPLS